MTEEEAPMTTVGILRRKTNKSVGPAAKAGKRKRVGVEEVDLSTDWSDSPVIRPGLGSRPIRCQVENDMDADSRISCTTATARTTNRRAIATPHRARRRIRQCLHEGFSPDEAMRCGLGTGVA
jgi:hypothetical protein